MFAMTDRAEAERESSEEAHGYGSGARSTPPAPCAPLTADF
jgi:hypothetical protein